MIRIVEAKNLGTACPTQWMCKDVYEKTWYARYRWGCLTVRSWEDDNDGTYLYSECFGDEYDGFLDYDELVRRTAGCIEWPEEQTWPTVQEAESW